jgi:hypothetical protein
VSVALGIEMRATKGIQNNHDLFLGHEENLRLFSDGKRLPSKLFVPSRHAFASNSIQYRPDSIRSGLSLTREQKMPESQDLFDDAKDSFHCGFACGVKRFSFPGLQPMSHGLHRSGILRRFGVLSETFGKGPLKNNLCIFSGHLTT